VAPALNGLGQQSSEYEQHVSRSADSALFARYRADFTRYLESWNTVQELSPSTKSGQAVAMMVGETWDRFGTMNATLDSLTAFNRNETAKADAYGDAVFAKARTQIAVAMVL